MGQRRTQRREAIITAAKELFLERDLSGVKMIDIVERSGISRVTLYAYFKSIHEVAYEVMNRVLRDIAAQVEATPLTGETGHDRFRETLLRMLAVAEEHPGHIRFMAMFDHVYQDAYPTPEFEAAYRSRVQEPTVFDRVLAEGQADGSIRTDIPAGSLIGVVVNDFLAMLQRMICRGRLLQAEHGTDPHEILLLHIDMLTDYLAPREAAERGEPQTWKATYATSSAR